MWVKLFYLLLVLVVGYLPYKIIQKTRPTGISHISSVTSFFLAFWFLLFSFVLFSQSQLSYIRVNSTVVAVFVGITVLWFTAPFVFRKIGVYPKETIGRNPKWYSLRYDPKTFHLKYLEVVFQQAQFFFLLTVVLAALPFSDRIVWFTVISALLHLGNIFLLSKREALLFFVLSIPMAIIFGILILNGLVLITTTIHLLFYLGFSGYWWFKKNDYISMLTR